MLTGLESRWSSGECTLGVWGGDTEGHKTGDK